MTNPAIRAFQMKSSFVTRRWWDEVAQWTYDSCKAFYEFNSLHVQPDYRLLKLGTCWGGMVSLPSKTHSSSFQDCQNPSYHAPAAYRVMRNYMFRMSETLGRGTYRRREREVNFLLVLWWGRNWGRYVLEPLQHFDWHLILSSWSQSSLHLTWFWCSGCPVFHYRTRSELVCSWDWILNWNNRMFRKWNPGRWIRIWSRTHDMEGCSWPYLVWWWEYAVIYCERLRWSS